MIAVSCVSCGKAMTMTDGADGRRAECPSCRQTLPMRRRPPVYELPTSLDGGTSDSSLTAFLAPPRAPGELGWLGGYRVLEIVGSGGMGVVFRAVDLDLEREIALKAMLPNLAAHATSRLRFVREAKAAAALQHDRIVAVYRVGEDRGVPFLAMPFLRGQSLEDRLKAGPLPIDEVRRLGAEIAEGLAAIHERGLIHRDIKPGNVWLEGSAARVKILDFGLARAGGDATLTREGGIVGSPAFMSPEQALRQPVDARADLFALGSRPLLDGDRPAALRRRGRSLDDAGHHFGGTDAALGAQRRSASRPGSAHPRLARQEPRRPLGGRGRSLAEAAMIAAIVLCGGQSSRMGTSKAWLPFGGEPMLLRILRVLEGCSPRVVVAAPGQLLPDLPDGVIVTRDRDRGRGPLQGLEAGLKEIVGAAYVSSCDVPLLSRRFVERMASLLGDDAIAVPETGGRRHPLAGVYRAGVVLPVVGELLAADRLRTGSPVRPRADAVRAGGRAGRCRPGVAAEPQYPGGVRGSAAGGGVQRANAIAASPPVARRVMARTAMSGHAVGLETLDMGAASAFFADPATAAPAGRRLPHESHQPEARSEGVRAALQWMQALMRVLTGRESGRRRAYQKQGACR